MPPQTEITPELLQFWYGKQAPKFNVSSYPADVQDLILVVCECWQLPPPNNKKTKGYWISTARQLLEACGEFGGQIIKDYHAEYLSETARLHRVPFYVSGPGSLIKVVYALAGQKRAKGVVIEVDRKKYTGGAFADFVER